MDYILKELVVRAKEEGELLPPKKIALKYSPEGKMSAWMSGLKEIEQCAPHMDNYTDYMVAISKDAIQLSAEVLEEATIDENANINDICISTFYKHDLYYFVVKVFFYKSEDNSLGILALIMFDDDPFDEEGDAI